MSRALRPPEPSWCLTKQTAAAQTMDQANLDTTLPQYTTSVYSNDRMMMVMAMMIQIPLNDWQNIIECILSIK